MAARNQWEDFYDGHAPFYDRGVFTSHTAGEVEFLVEVLGLTAGASVLDVGCGTGRHAIELARRGFRVTGVDLSSGMLLQAMRNAKAAGVEVEWVHAGAADYVAREPVDAVVCLCGGAFTVADLAADPVAHDRAILANVHRSLRPGGAFVLTTPNGYRRIREVTDADIAAGTFDPVTMIQVRDDDFDIGGAKGRMRYQERLYTLPELVTLLRASGFAVEHAWGGTAGRWGRRPLELDEIEVMVVAHRDSS
ncbi:MAG: class I SAM-dependent methyltransferase [Chloroflexi bacterium]|nr:class I SAM-dependent methyltransferase [Chloroflexota bacterium]